MFFLGHNSTVYRLFHPAKLANNRKPEKKILPLLQSFQINSVLLQPDF